MKSRILSMVIMVATVAVPGWSQQHDAGHLQAGTENLPGSGRAPVYVVPFASKNNTLELTVFNGSDIAVAGVAVTPRDTPSWIHLSPGEHHFDQLKAKSERTVTFTFDVDKRALVNREQKLTFNISASTREEWKKVILLKVGAPDRFELFQNYPNPFNPTTKIEYILPNDAHVRLIVYNTLGQEVARLVDGMQGAGYQSIEWHASNVPSGVYFYRVDGTVVDQANTRFTEIRKMILLR